MPIVRRSDVPQGLLMGAYGIPGCGKTAVAASFAQFLFERTGKPVLYGDWEFGERTVPSYVPMVLWMPDPTKDALDEMNSFLEEAERSEYSGFVTDTISSMADRMLISISEKNLNEGGKSTQRMRAKTEKGKEINHSTLADYGMAVVTFTQWAQNHYRLLNTGKHSLWCAHEKMVGIEQENGTNEILGGPDIVGRKLTSSAPKLLQVLLRMKMLRTGKGTERWLQVEDDGMYMAKDRFKALPQKGVNVTVTRDEGMDVDAFDKALINMGMKVWRTVFNRADKLRQEIKEMEAKATGNVDGVSLVQPVTGGTK